MSGITLDQITEQELGSQVTDFKEVGMDQQPEQEQQSSRFNELAQKALTAETGSGSIGDYLDHPMNFNKSQGLAQILRGLTGIIGNLDLAIIDIAFGALRFSKERKEVLNNDVLSRGGSLT